jgi:hypothetical protein
MVRQVSRRERTNAAEGAVTTSAIDPQTAETTAFLDALFARGDTVLYRPVETWTECGKKKSRVEYTGTQHLTILDAAESWRAAAILQSIKRRSEREKTNSFFGVCPRFGDDGFDRAWQIRTVRALWADIDNATVDEVLTRIEAAGLPRPSNTVSSGNGVHVYWLLDTPYLIDDIGDPPKIEHEWIEVGGK